MSNDHEQTVPVSAREVKMADLCDRADIYLRAFHVRHHVNYITDDWRLYCARSNAGNGRTFHGHPGMELRMQPDDALGVDTRRVIAIVMDTLGGPADIDRISEDHSRLFVPRDHGNAILDVSADSGAYHVELHYLDRGGMDEQTTDTPHGATRAALRFLTGQ